MTGLASSASRSRARLIWTLLALTALLATSCSRAFNPAPGQQASRTEAGKSADTYATTGAPAGGAEGQPAPPTFDRKIVRTGTMELVVKDAPTALAQLQALAEQLGGYVESSNLAQAGTGVSATIKLRIPAARFDQARTGARGIGLRVQSENVDASDVTRQFVDLEAALRNFRAEEAQYLEIMKRAGKIEEVLQVAERLSDVRGRIERTQSELNVLSHQVDMSTLTVNLVVQAEARVLGLEWRPLYNARRAFGELLQGLADYADSMVALLLYLPLLLVWVATIAFFALLAWKMGNWAWRRFLKRAPATPPAAG